MSKEESSSGGLFSKVVRFVRNPTAPWTDPAPAESEQDRESQYSKLMLKEMIERKRRNDFVRRREFDQLRKLRQRDALAGQRVEDPAGRPSFFQSSLTSPDERAGTIKKIDEIEAQMSMQWWKGKQGEAPPPPRTASVGLLSHQSRPQALAPTTCFAPTAPLSLPAALEPQAAAQPLFPDDSMVIQGFGGVSAQMSSTGVGAPALATPMARPVAVLEEFVHDPDLEEAAIFFANADYDGAAACLLGVLAQHAQDADSAQSFEIWMTLFDLYRATGQQDEFDKLAIDFAACFGRSAPLWFSIPEQLGLVPSTSATAQPAQAVRRDFSWHAPSTLTVQSVAALQASLARSVSPWTLIWDRLTIIEEAALPTLVQEFNRWADAKVQLVSIGSDRLQTLLQAHTQSGDRGGNPEWWRLRMAALRFMGRPDDFEMAALDYCVTYEVSPPSWQEPLCTYQDVSQGQGAGLDLLAPDLLDSAPAPASVPTEPLPVALPVPTGLSGHIEGDASVVLEGCEAGARAGQALVIACDRLIRIDFSAAGSVLNWAAAQQAQKREVQFVHLHRLVAVFFNVVGINEHAWIIPRKN